MAKAVTGRLSLGFLAGIVLAVLCVVVALALMAGRQNADGRAAALAAVTHSIESLGLETRQAAAEYALQGGFSERVAAVSEAILETVDRLFIVGADGRVSWSQSAEGRSQVPHELSAAANELAATANPFDPLGPMTFAVAGEDLFLLSVSPLSEVERLAAASPTEGAFVVAALRLDERRLADLGAHAGVEALRVELGPAPSGAEFPLIVGSHGEILGRFAWTPPSPGSAQLRGVLLPVGTILLLLCAVGGVAAFRTQRHVDDLVERERVAAMAARTDAVTGLLNRNGFHALLGSDRVLVASNLGQLGVVYLDINGFKSVNDSIGHRGGDELIRVLADRLASVLPPNTAFARIGGDEFAALLSGDNARDTIAGAAAALVHALEEPFLVSGFEFHVTAAVGYAIATRPGMAPGEILRRADLAMYQAKAASEREAVAYHATMETDALEKKRVEAALRRAIETGELTVVYQPIVRTSDMTVGSFEALVRWDSKEFGIMPPALFVPVAEETGLIHEVGSFVIHRVCQDLARWDTDLKISVNISPVQLRDPNFASDFLAMVERSGARAESFELELTEGILVSDPSMARRKLETLKKLGFGLSLDDFGTGFSSIGYLRQFPFTKLKVDRSFVREIGVNPTANALIQAVVSLGDAMDLAVVAEGLENEEQLSLLRLLQCEFIQGFYLSRPLTADQVATMLEKAGSGRPHIPLRGAVARSEGTVEALTA